MTLKSVVLPAPFGPMSATTCPASTLNDTRSRATTPPKRTLSSLTSRSAISRILSSAGQRRKLVAWLGNLRRVIHLGGLLETPAGFAGSPFHRRSPFDLGFLRHGWRRRCDRRDRGNRRNRRERCDRRDRRDRRPSRRCRRRRAHRLIP